MGWSILLGYPPILVDDLVESKIQLLPLDLCYCPYWALPNYDSGNIYTDFFLLDPFFGTWVYETFLVSYLSKDFFKCSFQWVVFMESIWMRFRVIPIAPFLLSGLKPLSNFLSLSWLVGPILVSPNPMSALPHMNMFFHSALPIYIKYYNIVWL